MLANLEGWEGIGGTRLEQIPAQRISQILAVNDSFWRKAFGSDK
jgi:hypothetical protein